MGEGRPGTRQDTGEEGLVLRGEGGHVRGWVDPLRGRIHAMRPGGWTLCGRRPGVGWYENCGFVRSGFDPRFPECLECERELPGAAS